MYKMYASINQSILTFKIRLIMQNISQIMGFTSRIDPAAFRLSLKYKLYAAYYGQCKCETEIFLQLFIRLLVVEYCVLNNFKYISMYFCIFTKSAIKGFSSIMFFDASQSHF